MTFRDDREAMRTRIEELGRELARVTSRSASIESERDAQRDRIVELERELAKLKDDPKVAARMRENARRTQEREEKERRERESAAKKRDASEAEARRKRSDPTLWLKILGGVAGVGVLGFGAYTMCVPATWLASDLPPTLGLVDLGANAAPAPIQLTATGGRSTPPGCVGSIPAAPQIIVRTHEPSLVSLAATCPQVDTVMVVLASDGTTVCDDDSGGAANPAIHTVLPPGDHRVWVGTYSDSSGSAPASLTVSRGVAPSGPIDSRGIAPTATPTHGEQHLTGGVPTPFAGTVLPSVSANAIDDRCRGFIAIEPSLALIVDEPSFVRLDGAGNDDLVLFVEGPDGSIRCDDDGGPGNMPLVADLFDRGRYAVWIGTYASRTTPAPYTLVMRGAPRAAAVDPAPRSLAIGGELVLEADDAVVRDAQCGVFVSGSPSAVIDLASGLDVAVRSAQPGTILRVEGPGGVRCLPSGVSTWPAGRHRVHVAMDVESGAGVSSVTLTAGAPSLLPYSP